MWTSRTLGLGRALAGLSQTVGFPLGSLIRTASDSRPERLLFVPAGGMRPGRGKSGSGWDALGP